MYIPTVHDKFFALKIEIQYNLFNILFFIEGEIWNLDHLVPCGIPYANTYGIPRNSAEFRAILLQKIPRNFAEFRGIPYVFQKIPSSVGSQKHTSVDTLIPSFLSSSSSLSLLVLRYGRDHVKNPKTINRKEMDQICSEALRQQETEVRKLPAAEADAADRFVSPTNPTRRPATSSAVITAQAPTTTGRPVAAVGPKAGTKQVRYAFSSSVERTSLA
jgi:hypothetical protein